MTITYLAKTNFRNQNKTFGIKQQDRLSHSYILGKTGTGKSTLLFNMIYQDLCNFQGFVLLDPHGELADKVVNNMPECRKQDVIYLDISDLNLEVGYNPLKRVAKENRALVVSGIIEILKKLHDKKSWGVKMEHILRNVLFTLLDQEQADFTCISKILLDKSYRQSCLKDITNDEVKKFWTDEYDKYHQFTKANMISPILNKLSAFLTSPVARNILVDNKEQISFRKAMDQRKVVIINLAKGKTGEDVSSLLGGLLLHSVALASFSRANISEEDRRDFFVYVDEFQSFTTLSIANMLSELRKYRTGLILANQYLYQLDNQIKEAVLGNVGTLISFRLGVKDATYMQKEFYPRFDFNDIINLPNYQIYLKLLIDGNPSKAFSAKTIYNYKVLKNTRG